MKNRFFCLLISFFFLLGNSSFGHAFSTEFGGGVELHIHNTKTGSIIYSFSIPDEYTNTNGKLIFPLEIELNNNQTSTLTTQNDDLQAILHNLTSGQYRIKIRIGSFSHAQNITL